MTADEALRELLSISTDIRRAAVLDESGALLASGPGAVGASAGEAARSLWKAAARRASSFGDREFEHVVVQQDDGAVAVVAAKGRLLAALTGPRPALGLVLFDMRTCLADAFGEES